ncbi:HlyD family secretion protein [Microbulbifer spongiae]|uniref:HlyD family efflux transporter periplasmic adaptor subunit n=1 Tax=Microbulbifer spongiae TaxID=2944933 RepID=A0ABY9ED68_9GAMM|nr:HlyD family efflux transporter periplasmic adaptor subunit [Microbulbifer sp. MI-G]WKD49469.1 HlyD family efflux transporter periplasmic adaptor subunit [Microbulbifer sp. MI-G]WKD50304.1 HlyD family efflux transporter periplasmic adaptor subunit [Microbulbifer sp. MI-G]
MTGLFRRQAMEKQADRLHGEILLLPRLSHTLILSLLLAWVVAVIIWLAGSHYARRESVTGWLEPASGVVRVYAERSGIIKQVLVREGDRVIKDQPLIVVNGDRILADGKHLESLLLTEYKSQQQLVSEQLKRSEKIYHQQLRDLDQRIVAGEEDLALLEKQIETQTQRYILIAEQAERYRRLKRDGHISSAELDAVIAQELELQADRQSLARSGVNLRNQIRQLESDRLLLPEEFANSSDQLRARLSDLAQQIAQLHGQRAYIVKASRDGVISNLQATEGQQARADIPILSLVPENHVLTAQLLVPVRSAGFLTTGQPLKIRYDAFPYQKFGLYPGAVLEVSDTVLLPDELLRVPVAVREPVFRVTAKLAQPTVNAYGRHFSLKPGMTLSADVQLAERSLLQWLLEPIYSLRGRL